MIGSSTCSSDPDSAYQFYEDSYGAKWYTGFFPIGQIQSGFVHDTGYSRKLSSAAGVIVNFTSAGMVVIFYNKYRHILNHTSKIALSTFIVLFFLFESLAMMPVGRMYDVNVWS